MSISSFISAHTPDIGVMNMLKANLNITSLHDMFPTDGGMLSGLTDNMVPNMPVETPILKFWDLLDLIKNRFDHTKHYPEEKMTFKEIVEAQGFGFEEHKVHTKDKYILTMHRIINPNNKVGAPAVLCQHGLLSQSDTWIDNEPDVAVAFKIAKMGYDVWFGNNRGNVYSNEHETLDIEKDSQKFFDYSFQDLGEYDTPAQVDYVLKVTGQQNLGYVGHSQGTSQMFYALSTQTNKTFSDKINVFVALAPIVRFKNAPMTIKLAKLVNFPIREMFNGLKQYSLFGADFIERIKDFEDNNIIGAVLYIVLKSVLGENKYNNEKWLQICSAWSPARASVKEMVHYGQMIASGDFRSYDYLNEELNIEHYGQPTPPILDISKVDVPVGIFVGTFDPLANPIDAKWAADLLPNLTFYEEIGDFDHSSYLSGKDMAHVDDIIYLLDTFKTV